MLLFTLKRQYRRGDSGGGRGVRREETMNGLDLGGLTVTARPILQHSGKLEWLRRRLLHLGTTGERGGIKAQQLVSLL